MSSESDSWAAYRPLITCLDPVRIEHRYDLGIPDVNYVEGWIENKHVAKWPVRAKTLINIEHFTPEQRGWLTRRCRAGGAAWFMLHVSGPDHWVLLKGDVAAAAIGTCNRAQLLSVAALCSVGLPNRIELLKLLRGR